ncbi:MAG: hypothetical protein DI564_05160 [Rhodanobacter denitrificans]|uniref:Glycosyltransferase RgtA/B/C/D-like domain-containing protein n=1 Tax=Rhodanobacter denitrificans TaxID=666685 RepID=A0A2W5MY66_9GAMM|nr:MAG: hypothetical protein DI564_05160 [Rhodanobacter denitrificans]
MTYLLIVAVIVLLGTGLVAAAIGWPRDRVAWGLVAGLGLFVGMVACAVLAGLLMPERTDRLPLRVPIAAALIAVAAWGFAWLRRATAQPAPAPARSRGARILWWAAWVLATVHLWPLAREIWLRPAFPWDAWATWLIKPKAWFLSGRFEPYVAPADWLAGEGTRTMVGWNYPELSAWLQLLLAQARGGWEEPLLLLPWFALLVALLVGVYALARRLDVAPVGAAVAAYALASMPLLDSHVALAGYLDLWVATAVVFALGAWLCWLREPRSRGCLVLAIGLAACLPLLKREGAVWLALLAGLMVYARCGPRLRRGMLLSGGVLAGVLVLAVLVAGDAINGWLAGTALIPNPGQTEGPILAWRPEGLAIVVASFGADNWHLLMLALVLIVPCRWWRLREDPRARLVGLFLSTGWIFLLFLFCLTPASSWAQSETAAHRLVMHLVPATVLWLALLFGDSPNPSRTAGESDGVR